MSLTMISSHPTSYSPVPYYSVPFATCPLWIFA